MPRQDGSREGDGEVSRMRRRAKRARRAASARDQRGTRQSPYKMRLVIDQIRGKNVNEALALLDVLEEARGEADREDAAARRSRTRSTRRARTNESLDVDALYIKHAVVNEGPKLKRFMPAAQGRATPIQKRTSHVEIVVGREGRDANGTEDQSDRLPPRHLARSGARASTRAASCRRCCARTSCCASISRRASATRRSPTS